jgi:hypothetical protein
LEETENEESKEIINLDTSHSVTVMYRHSLYFMQLIK